MFGHKNDDKHIVDYISLYSPTKIITAILSHQNNNSKKYKYLISELTKTLKFCMYCICIMPQND